MKTDAEVRLLMRERAKGKTQEQAAARAGMSVRTAGKYERAGALPPRVEAELLRIAQEALANVRRHAHATQVAVLFRTTPEEAILTIRDNGLGFEPRRPVEGHHGIVGMRERAKLLGGRLRLTSHPGRGTTVTVRVPLAEGAP